MRYFGWALWITILSSVLIWECVHNEPLYKKGDCIALRRDTPQSSFSAHCYGIVRDSIRSSECSDHYGKSCYFIVYVTCADSKQAPVSLPLDENGFSFLVAENIIEKSNVCDGLAESVTNPSNGIGDY